MPFNDQEEQYFFPDTPKMVQWVIKHSGGLVKDERQANFVLMGIIALAIIISLVLIFGSGGTSYDDQSYNESIYEEELLNDF